MSAALVRQALEFVDSEESVGKPKKKRGRLQPTVGQDLFPVLELKPQAKKQKQTESVDCEDKNKEVITKLLKLSQQALDQQTAEKIVKRAVTQKPVFDKIEVKEEVTESILFPELNKKNNKKKSRKNKI